MTELITYDPFASGVGISKSIWLPLPKIKKDLPSFEQMKQVFKLMAGDLTPEKPPSYLQRTQLAEMVP